MRRALLASLLLHAALLLAAVVSWPPWQPALPAPVVVSLLAAPPAAAGSTPVAPARAVAHDQARGVRAATLAPARAAAQPAAQAMAPAPAAPASVAPAVAAADYAQAVGGEALASSGSKRTEPARAGSGREAGNNEPGSSRPPRVLQAPQPDYPAISRDLGEQGVVMLRLAIDADGKLNSRPVVLKSSGFTRLDRAARDGVTRWQFQPAQENGRLVAAVLELPVRFSLDEK